MIRTKMFFVAGILKSLPPLSSLTSLNFCVLTILACGACIGQAALAAGEEGKRPFRVADSIAMTRLVDPPVDLAVYAAPKFKISPDGRHFAIVTRKGNLATGKNEFRLLLYKSAEVLDFVNDKTTPRSRPVAQSLLKIAAAANENAIRGLRWLSDNEHLAFIGDIDGVKAQVYSLNIRSGTLRRLTDHPRPVASFELNDLSDALIYISSVEVIRKGWGTSSFVIGSMYFEEVMNPKPESLWPEFQYYLATPEGPRALGGAFPASQGAPRLWLSPDGERAITLLPVSMAETPESWKKSYHPIATNPFYKPVFEEFDPNTMRPRQIFETFTLIDMEKGTVTPLLNAPSGQFIGGFSTEVTWAATGKKVILANTFLPLDIDDPQERERRRRMPAIVEYDLQTRQIERIADIAVSPEPSQAGEWFLGLERLGQNLLRLDRRRTAGAGPLPPRFFERGKGRWKEVEAQEPPQNPEQDDTPVPARLSLSIRQDMMTAPEIMARDAVTGAERIITDLNPQFRTLAFGRAELFQWTDRRGRPWKAGLVYPPDFKTGEHYPLVIQTHGFSSDEFLIDGPHGTPSAFAAQALANKGMLVMQLPDYPGAAAGRAALEVHRTGIESAIDALEEKNILDRDKVGLIGWSATGLYVQDLITFSDYDFAAATIADAHGISLMSYILMFGSPAPGMHYMEERVEAMPWGDQLQSWIERDPTLHLDRVHTPLRLEIYGRTVLAWWDSYAILRRLQRPVEFLMFPNGTHVLTKPQERYESQQGNVDWFSFWLLGEEDPDPEKAAQYERWRALRQQHEKALRQKTPARE